jgi:hypothetical protein
MPSARVTRAQLPIVQQFSAAVPSLAPAQSPQSGRQRPGVRQSPAAFGCPHGGSPRSPSLPNSGDCVKTRLGTLDRKMRRTQLTAIEFFDLRQSSDSGRFFPNLEYSRSLFDLGAQLRAKLRFAWRGFRELEAPPSPPPPPQFAPVDETAGPPRSPRADLVARLSMNFSARAICRTAPGGR